MENKLLAVSPIDGRYNDKIEHLSQYFSEAALMRYRILIEIEWFIFLFNDLKLPGTKELETMEMHFLRTIYEQFDVENAKRVKEIEKVTNHDVKAVEYFIKEQLNDGPLEKYSEFLHFGCTSEDINNLSYSCMVRDFVDRDFIPTVSGLVREIFEKAQDYKSLSMMSRTHGQPATTTTLGKELINVVARLEREICILAEGKFHLGKINGAVGNYNAHMVAYPDVDWIDVTCRFVDSLGLIPNLYTIQIEPHDGLADIFDCIKRINNIILDFDRDMWGYISLGYFKQKAVKGEVGSSTMPHKVNPIDFENSEGNIGIANALLEHMSSKLQISRMQRDLSDSTVLRNVGLVAAYGILAIKSTIKGFSKCEVDKKIIKHDLKDRWELLAEPIQMVMRKNLVPDAYEKLKELTRGKKINKAAVQDFIKSLKLPAKDEKNLLDLTPENYTGLAEKLVERYELSTDLDQVGCGPSGCGGCQGCG